MALIKPRDGDSQLGEEGEGAKKVRGSPPHKAVRPQLCGEGNVFGNETELRPMEIRH